MRQHRQRQQAAYRRLRRPRRSHRPLVDRRLTLRELRARFEYADYDTAQRLGAVIDQLLRQIIEAAGERPPDTPADGRSV